MWVGLAVWLFVMTLQVVVLGSNSNTLEDDSDIEEAVLGNDSDIEEAVLGNDSDIEEAVLGNTRPTKPT